MDVSSPMNHGISADFQPVSVGHCVLNDATPDLDQADVGEVPD